MKVYIRNAMMALILIQSQFVYGAHQLPDVWQVMRQQFALNHQTHRPEVKRQIQWIKEHPEYLKQLSLQSAPYIYHILSQVKERGMPGEIALIPMIESAYDPFAYSHAGAAGIWQLMPGTGSGLGLKQDWWFDGRRSLIQSTDAALNHLNYLHGFFKGKWIFAIAAYDAGEGKLLRAIKATHQTREDAQFWQLALPKETKAYIPRLLAIAAIIKHPHQYGMTLPTILYQPYFEKVLIGSQIDLAHAANMAGITYKELINLNPGHNRWATAPNQPFHLLIPKHRVEPFSKALADLPKEKRVSWTRHQVKKGDTLDKIALSYHTTVKLIKHINGLKSNTIRLNQYILIPKNHRSKNLLAKKHPKINKIDRSTNSRFKRSVHVVQNGDSLWKISKKYGVTIDQIRYWNKLSYSNQPTSGTPLVIWKRIRYRPTYTVRQGDTLGHIALKHHVSIKKIYDFNPNLNPKLIKPGQKIRLG